VPRNDRDQTADAGRRRQLRLPRSGEEGASGLKVEPVSAMPLERPLGVQRIDVRGLSKTFQLAGAAIEAVRDASFSVRRGEFVALLGPSGSGKSTILNMIATL